MSMDDTIEHVVEEENYFVSMTDMMVGLVFIFIIMLMYFVLQFRDVTDQLVGANQTRTEILKQLERTLKAEGVDVQLDTQNGVLRLPDAILFDSGHAELKPEGRIAVGHLADALSDVLPCYTDFVQPGEQRPVSCPKSKHRIESVYVEGHTDQDPLSGGGLFRDNWDLSVVRATNTYREVTGLRPNLVDLCARKPGGRCEPVLSVSGYGPQRPVEVGDSDETKRRNRRIDLRLIMVTPDAGQTAQAVAKQLGSK
jgi:flagellar motor protein MotB